MAQLTISTSGTVKFTPYSDRSSSNVIRVTETYIERRFTMKIKTTVNTKVATTKTFKRILSTDDGVAIATMSATLNNASPLGNNSIFVQNREKYEKFEAAVKDQKAAFTTEVLGQTVTTEDSSETTTDTIEVEGEDETEETTETEAE